jgi:hypothetical protein
VLDQRQQAEVADGGAGNGLLIGQPVELAEQSGTLLVEEHGEPRELVGRTLERYGHWDPPRAWRLRGQG